MIMHRVVENIEPLRQVEDTHGVSHKTIRRIILHDQKQRGQQEV